MNDEGNRIKGDRIRGRNTDQADGYEEKVLVTEDVPFQVSLKFVSDHMQCGGGCMLSAGSLVVNCL